MEHLSNDQKNHPDPYEHSQKPHDEAEHPVLILLESQWNLRQQHIRISQWRKSHCRTNTSIRRSEINLKDQECESHSQGTK